MRRARWIWENRIPKGELSLLAGREGTGKSTIAVDLAASLTRGTLPGEYLGKPAPVMIVASEDSMEHTIKPRLLAAAAVMPMVFRVIADEGDNVRLPFDLASLEELQKASGSVLLVLDPLISRLGELDTHRDADVRQALEPLVAMSERLGLAVVGLIHHNKTGTSDPLTALMGSRAFAAVARSVLTASYDPDDESRSIRLLAHAKSSLGRQAPTLAYSIGEKQVGDDEGPVMGSTVKWMGEDDRNAYEIAAGPAEKRVSKRDTATDWLRSFLEREGPSPAKSVIVAAKLQIDVSEATIDRAARELDVIRTKEAAYQGGVVWRLP